jgi:hypothetical protein
MSCQSCLEVERRDFTSWPCGDLTIRNVNVSETHSEARCRGQDGRIARHVAVLPRRLQDHQSLGVRMT